MGKKVIIKKNGSNGYRAGIVIDNQLYYSALFTNGLFKKDLLSEKHTFLMNFDENSVEYLHSFAIEHGDEIWFLPGVNGTKFAVFNIRSEQLEYIEINPPINNIGWLFCGGVIEGNILYAFPGTYGSILGINMESRKIEFTLDLKEAVFSNAVKLEETVFINSWDCSNAVLFDIRNKQIKYLKGYKKAVRYLRAIPIENNVWMIPHEIKEKICIYDVKNNSFDYIDMPLCGDNSDTFLSTVFTFNGVICFLVISPDKTQIFQYSVKNKSLDQTELITEEGEKFVIAENYSLESISENFANISFGLPGYTNITFNNNKISPMDIPYDLSMFLEFLINKK